MPNPLTRLGLAALTATLAIAGALVMGPESAAAQTPTPPRFEPADCALLLARAATGPLDNLFSQPNDGLRCGYVTVPAEHAKPTGPTIKLAVVVLPARDAKAVAPDPLFMLQGGPGGSTIDTYAVMMRVAAVGASRDIVLFDQRGTGKSQPSLKCDEVFAYTRANAERLIDHATGLREGDATLQACHERLIREGVNLSAFDSLENAADVNDVRLALGYDKINVYGVSYGTLLAQHVMRPKPAWLRSVILDSVVPAQTNFIVDVARSENRALTELFSACAADPRCNADYPNLERVYLEQIERLNKTPARARAIDPTTNKVYNTYVDGDTLRALVFQALYSTEILPLLPRMIYAARENDFNAWGKLITLMSFDTSLAQGMYLSVLCAEDADFNPADAASPDVRAPQAKYAVEDAKDFLNQCATWKVEALPATVDQPVQSDTPTLIFNGRFDPITPPAYGATVARSLSRSTSVVFPNSGHGGLRLSPTSCSQKLLAAFLNAPTSRLEASCVDGLGAPAFLARSEILAQPIVGEFLTYAGQDTTLQAGLLGVLLLAVLTTLLVIPLGWLFRTIFKRHHPTRKPPLLATLSAWSTVVAAGLLLVFLIGFLVLPVLDAGGDAYTFLIGVSAGMRPVYILPWLIALLTALTVAGVIAGVASPAWGVLRKLYRSAAALGLVAACAILLIWGTFGTLFGGR